MSKPKILNAIDEVDERGFYRSSKYLGDIRENPNCLDDTIENGVYAFTGGATSPTDDSNDYMWSLEVKSCDSSIIIEQIAERLTVRNRRIVYIRSRSNTAKWGEFIEDSSISVIIKEWDEA